jgi:hypothetical protein
VIFVLSNEKFCAAKDQKRQVQCLMQIHANG